MPVERLESLGVKLTSADGDVAAPNEAERRQLQAQELEQRQKFWRWFILAAIAVLFVESLLAGRLSRPAAENASA